MGAVEFHSGGDRLVAQQQHSGACGYEPTRVVLRGEFEGNVLAGWVTLCQTGSGCKERTYPLLAVFNPQDKSLTAQVKLETGCFSPALRGSTLKLELAGDAERAARPASGSRSSELKAAKKTAQRHYQLATQAVLRGDALLKSGDYDGAAQEFARAVSFAEGNFIAHNGLGVAEFLNGNILNALRAYERARDLAPEEADTYVNIASVYARLGDRTRALDNLRAALKHRLSNPELITHDEDLKRLLGADPEYVKIVESIGSRKKGRTP